ncbi:MAG TPA: methionine adenosyltransferase [Kiritimatiellia bacterium]|nr:methionine adenosyltransferase [Kiritimatiellia bacterium]
MQRLFTSESVTEGHPDKLCDQIADAILDNIIAEDPDARVACEVCTTTGMVLVMGEITASAQPDISAIARGVIRDVGYTGNRGGFDADACALLVAVDKQSDDIRQGVTKLVADPAERFGAGDQGMVFGYACDETPELMPLPITLAHRLAMQLAAVRKAGTLGYLRPDGKTQVTVEYGEAGPERVHTVVVSAQHDADIDQEQITADIIGRVIMPIIPEDGLGASMRILVNPSGRFVNGGPAADSGLTGRKLIVDTYGGMCRHGGGAFSGKDPTKVDRSGAYAARHAAKNLVAAGLASRCEVQIAYAIGVAHPVAVAVDTFGTGLVPDDALAVIARQVFDFRPAAIIDRLGLARSLYRQTAAYGHFGKPNLPWEAVDAVPELLSRA